MKRIAVSIIFLSWMLLLTSSCGEAPKPAAAEKEVSKKPAAEPPADETRRFPADGRESVEVIAANLLGKDFLPGGNLATYKKGAKTWKQFVIKTSNEGQTAVLLSKMKDSLQDPKFVAHMGGYFGTDGGQPVFVFPKAKWIAGTIGLPQQEADTACRVMALRLD